MHIICTAKGKESLQNLDMSEKDKMLNMQYIPVMLVLVGGFQQTLCSYAAFDTYCLKNYD